MAGIPYDKEPEGRGGAVALRAPEREMRDTTEIFGELLEHLKVPEADSVGSRQFQYDPAWDLDELPRGFDDDCKTLERLDPRFLHEEIMV